MSCWAVCCKVGWDAFRCSILSTLVRLFVNSLIDFLKQFDLNSTRPASCLLIFNHKTDWKYVFVSCCRIPLLEFIWIYHRCDWLSRSLSQSARYLESCLSTLDMHSAQAACKQLGTSTPELLGPSINLLNHTRKPGCPNFVVGLLLCKFWALYVYRTPNSKNGISCGASDVRIFVLAACVHWIQRKLVCLQWLIGLVWGPVFGLWLFHRSKRPSLEQRSRHENFTWHLPVVASQRDYLFDRFPLHAHSCLFAWAILLSQTQFQTIDSA